MRAFEGSALASVVQALAAAAESLHRTMRGLEAQRPEEWMGSEQCAAYLRTTPRAFKRIAPHLPRRYVSNQVILYPRSLVDEALYAAASPEEAIVGICRHADKSTRSETPQGGTGAAESIRKAMAKG